MKKVNFYTLLLVICSCVLYSCNDEPKNDKKSSQNKDSEITTIQNDKQPDVNPTQDSLIKKDSIIVPTNKGAQVMVQNDRYMGWVLKDNDSLKKIIAKLTPAQKKVIYALNRVDNSSVNRIDTLVVPKNIEDLMHYSPFPATVNSLKEIPKMAIFSYPVQAYGIYENGNLVKWGPTSMGSKAHKTPTGLFFTNWKGKEIRSSVNKSWILKFNFNISNHGGVGWHQYALPGYPASHSCLRLLLEDAQWLYTWADQWVLKEGQVKVKGTPVLVFGEYPWGKRRPWKNMLDNPNANNISSETLDNLITPHVAEILKEQGIRQNYINQNGNIDNKGTDSVMTQEIQP